MSAADEEELELTPEQRMTNLAPPALKGLQGNIVHMLLGLLYWAA
jgi:hypothetical protein